MNGVNKVILIGNLGADPETRYGASGTAMCTIKVATSETWKDKQSGEKQSRTEWHRVKFFGKLAEIAGEYLKKGKQVYVEGSIRTDKYTDEEGVERYATDIIAREMQMLGGNPNTERAPSKPVKDRPQPETTGGGFADDDIPFAPLGKRSHWIA